MQPLRRATETPGHRAEKVRLRLSVSLWFVGVGIAAWKDWMTRPDDLLAAAEEAMETARAQGGDRIEVHPR